MHPMLEHLKPRRVSQWNSYPDEVPLTRLGRDNDGGYLILCNGIKHGGNLFSFGIADDPSFELDLVNHFPLWKVHAFDHTARYDGRLAHPNIWMNRIGLGPVTGENKITINDLVIDYIAGSPDYVDVGNDILKIDIEGDEWDCLSHDAECIDHFDQIVIEFHNLIVMINNPVAQHVLDRMLKQFIPVHLHANNYGAVGPDGLPDTIEVTWANHDYYTEIGPARLPHSLDQPNDPNAPEIML